MNARQCGKMWEDVGEFASELITKKRGATPFNYLEKMKCPENKNY